MERDFPIGHPAAGDYKGEPFNPPRAPYTEDFPEGHPARGGANTKAADTPDGMRAVQAQQALDFDELIHIGAIPVDREHEANDLAPGGTDEEKALAFLARRGYSEESALGLIEQVGVEHILASGASMNTRKAG